MTHIPDPETAALIRRWIDTFREVPVLLDPELMRAVLDAQPDRKGEV